jgi:hypothetical protein
MTINYTNCIDLKLLSSYEKYLWIFQEIGQNYFRAIQLKKKDFIKDLKKLTVMTELFTPINLDLIFLKIP